MSRTPEIDPAIAVRFVEIAFEPDDWLAVLVKRRAAGHVGQRVAPASTITNSPFQDWLVRENRVGASVYLSVNALKRGTALRRRRAVAAVRHVFLDADENLTAVLATIAARADMPEPSYVLRTSEDRGHVFWRTEGFPVDVAESLEKCLARELHTDPAATACSQLTRFPGYLNHKRAPAFPVAVEYGAIDVRYRPADFPTRVTHRKPRHQPEVHRGDTSGDPLERARLYLAAAPPAVSGQHGDVHTFRICCRLVRGFALSDPEALRVLAGWNATCRPPWAERDLIDKLGRARKYGREPMGGLLGDRA